MRVACYCLMPNHWHLVLWPREDGQLSEFLRLLTVTHTQRWHAHYHSAGTGPLYQGRFKSFPIQRDEHFLNACRYVERNAVRANLVQRAEAWPWCSAFERHRARASGQPLPPWLLEQAKWPVAGREDWLRWVNEPQTQTELEALRQSVVRGSPYGHDRWRALTARRLGLESSLRPRGRPRVREEVTQDSRPLRFDPRRGDTTTSDPLDLTGVQPAACSRRGDTTTPRPLRFDRLP